MDIQNIGNEKLPSNLKDPFSTTLVTAINVHGYIGSWDKNWVYIGNLEFKNGDTVGKQNFKGESFDEVTASIKLFMENLK